MELLVKDECKEVCGGFVEKVKTKIKDLFVVYDNETNDPILISLTLEFAEIVDKKYHELQTEQERCNFINNIYDLVGTSNYTLNQSEHSAFTKV